MKPVTRLAMVSLALSLAACGGSQDTAPTETSPPKAPIEKAAGDPMDHSGHDMGDMGDGLVGHATGVIKSLGSRGEFLTIDHGPIEGVGMGAMTMGFELQGDVDLSGLAEGDTVAFMVRKGRDNAYRIAAICNTGTDGADCLAGLMNH